MIVVTSDNGAVGIEEAVSVLKAGGMAIDAVEAGIRLVEAIGYTNWPDGFARSFSTNITELGFSRRLPSER